MKGTPILLQVEWDAIETLVFGFKVKSERGVVKSKMGQSHLNLWVEITAPNLSQRLSPPMTGTPILWQVKREKVNLPKSGQSMFTVLFCLVQIKVFKRMSVYVLNWPNSLCQIVWKWQTPLEELCKKLQIRFRISDTSAGYSNQNWEDMLKMIMDRWNQMKTDFDLQLYIASFGPEVWIFPMFQIEIWQMAGYFLLFKSLLHFHFKLYNFRF